MKTSWWRVVCIIQSRVTIQDAEAQFPLHTHTISKEEITMALVSQFLLGLVKSWVTEAETKDRVASSLVSRPSTVLAAWWEWGRWTCRAQSHCPFMFPENNVKSPSKGTQRTVRGLCSQNVTEYKNLVFSLHALSL